MKVIDPGHKYEVDCLDGTNVQTIQFVKRTGVNYPNNTSAYGGTNCQELLRVLISRVKYLDGQHHDACNERIVENLRSALWEFEQRAVKKHGGVEVMKTCKICGHIACIHGDTP